jgi:hypothetical protein
MRPVSRLGRRLLLQADNGTHDVFHQTIGHVAAEALADDDA